MTPDDSGIRYEGGDGRGAESAIVICGAADSMQGISAEYEWLEREYPGANMKMQSLRHEGDRIYDVLEFETEDGASRELWFDITEVFGKL